jgi:hypothetical protein
VRVAACSATINGERRDCKGGGDELLGGGGVEEGERSPKMLDFKATHFKQNVAFSIETILSTQPKGDFGR